MTNTDPNDEKYNIDRRSVLKLASVIGLGAALSGTGLADDSSPDGEPIEPEGSPPWQDGDGGTAQWADDQWFVEFEAPPTARGGTPSEHADERAQLRAEARRENVAFAERRAFTALWNGLSVNADLAHAYAMSGLDSVEAVYPVALVEPPEPAEASPELATAVGMTGADRAQMELGYTGAGTNLGIIDTGIDYNHPDLGRSGDPENVIEADADRTFDHLRISHGWDYVGEDLYDGDPNLDPMDPRGHGTHVAGIGDANAENSEEGVTGVAPEIGLGAYKVFPPSGPTTADVMVEALEDAYEDGMDVVNMSIGASPTWGQEYPPTAASNELANQGVVVVNSAGNDGDLGAWSLSAPANAHDIISVASVENEYVQAPAFEVAQLDEPVPYDPLTGTEDLPIEGESAPPSRTHFSSPPERVQRQYSLNPSVSR
jgi:subtilisin family serine protease